MNGAVALFGELDDDEQLLLTAAADRLQEIRAQEREDLAARIVNGVAKLFK